MTQYTCEQCPLFDINKKICELTGDPENPKSVACMDSPLRKLDKKIRDDLQPFIGLPNTPETRQKIKEAIEQRLLDYHRAFVEQMLNEGWSHAMRGGADEQVRRDTDGQHGQDSHGAGSTEALLY